MHPFDNRIRTCGALVLTLVFGLLPALPWAEHAVADDRVLRVQDGAEIVSFDPFYLVWTSADDGIDVDTRKLPWPFQLTEIRRFDRETYFAPARPPADADDV